VRIGAAVVAVVTTITARHRPLTIYAHVMPGMQAAAAKLFGDLMNGTDA
jgi:hypothetical protein